MNSYKKSIMAALMAFSLVAAPAVYANPTEEALPKAREAKWGNLSYGQIAIPAVGGFLAGIGFNKMYADSRDCFAVGKACICSGGFMQSYRPIFRIATRNDRAKQLSAAYLQHLHISSTDDSDNGLSLALYEGTECALKAIEKEQEENYNVIEACSFVAGFLANRYLGESRR